MCACTRPKKHFANSASEWALTGITDIGGAGSPTGRLQRCCNHELVDVLDAAAHVVMFREEEVLQFISQRAQAIPSSALT